MKWHFAFAILACVACGQKSADDAGADATTDVAIEHHEDASASDVDAADSFICLPTGSQCTDPSVCCRTVCEFTFGQGGPGKCQ